MTIFYSQLACAHTQAAQEKEFSLDPDEINKKLSSEGLVGWVHGAVSEHFTYVFVYRDPKNFFIYQNFPIFTTDESLMKKLSNLKRNDKIKIWGEINDSPRRPTHLFVNKFEILKKYDHDLARHERHVEIPEGLLENTQAKALVHAVEADQGILVLERGEFIFPVKMRNKDLLKKLYRNDLVEFHYTVDDSNPHRPPHFKLNESHETPLKVIEAIAEIHEKEATLSGRLVMFPKSPMVSFNVFALEQKNGELTRYYTLINFEDFELFKAIREKLQKAWDEADPSHIQFARNKMISSSLKIEATGILNLVSPSQANPQVILNSLEDIQLDD